MSSVFFCNVFKSLFRCLCMMITTLLSLNVFVWGSPNNSHDFILQKCLLLITAHICGSVLF